MPSLAQFIPYFHAIYVALNHVMSNTYEKFFFGIGMSSTATNLQFDRQGRLIRRLLTLVIQEPKENIHNVELLFIYENSHGQKCFPLSKNELNDLIYCDVLGMHRMMSCLIYLLIVDDPNGTITHSSIFPR